jgi:hypothetical protein
MGRTEGLPRLVAQPRLQQVVIVIIIAIIIVIIIVIIIAIIIVSTTTITTTTTTTTTTTAATATNHRSPRLQLVDGALRPDEDEHLGARLLHAHLMSLSVCLCV